MIISHSDVWSWLIIFLHECYRIPSSWKSFIRIHQVMYRIIECLHLTQVIATTSFVLAIIRLTNHCVHNWPRTLNKRGFLGSVSMSFVMLCQIVKLGCLYGSVLVVKISLFLVRWLVITKFTCLLLLPASLSTSPYSLQYNFCLKGNVLYSLLCQWHSLCAAKFQRNDLLVYFVMWESIILQFTWTWGVGSCQPWRRPRGYRRWGHQRQV